MTSSLTLTRNTLSTMARNDPAILSNEKVLKNHIQDVIFENSEYESDDEKQPRFNKSEFEFYKG